MTDVVERIRRYLSFGGMNHPEMMNHQQVRDLVIDCRDEIDRLNDTNSELALNATFYAERSRKLQDALCDLMDNQNGPPLVTYTESWNKAMEKCYAILKEIQEYDNE